jgi:hypothetical protein
MPVKPSKPVMIEMTKKMSAHLSMDDLRGATHAVRE